MKQELSLFSHPDVSLEDHLLEVAKRVERFCEELQLEKDLRKTAYLTALSHDLGKTTKFFQEHLRGQKVSTRLSGHALLSAILATNFLAREIPLDLKISLFMAIRYHHGKLPKVKDALYLDKGNIQTLKEQLSNISEESFRTLLTFLGFSSFESINLDIEKFKRKFFWPASDLVNSSQDLSLYFTTNLLLGMLVDADIRAVIKMDANEERIEIPENAIDRYLETLQSRSSINNLREEFYQTVIKNVLRDALQNQFFSITAPTGIGKTLTGLSAAFRLRHIIAKEQGRLPRIIYVLPFTSIIDQNFEVIANVLKKIGLSEDILLKHHFRSSPLETSSEIKAKDVWKNLEEDELFSNNKDFFKIYEQAHTRVETWDGEVIVTTFVRFFETLFTNRRSEMRRLHRLAGSTVILDEVQNIPVAYWEATEEALKFLAKKWNTRFILMTATRPALLPKAKELTEPKKQFFFESLSRTKLFIEINPVAYKEVQHWLLPKIKGSQSFMVVMNTIRAAQEVYETLKEEINKYKLYFLSASLIPFHREKRILALKQDLDKGLNVGLVATQVVEAGVDLDFDIVIRDLAPFDSVVQAAGRCNRNSNESEGEVFLVTLSNPNHGERRLATYIYDGVLIGITEELLTKYNMLSEKDYLIKVEEYFRQLEERKAQDKDLLDNLKNLNYEKIAGFDLLVQRIPQVPVFVELDDKASILIKKLKELEHLPSKNYDERMERRKRFKFIAPGLWAYVVNIPIKVAVSTGLVPLPYASSFLWLERGRIDFNDIYKEETGFVRQVSHETIFL